MMEERERESKIEREVRKKRADWEGEREAGKERGR